MFRPKKILKATVYIPLSAVKSTHDKLFAEGICHIDFDTKSSDELSKLEDSSQYAQRLITRLEKYKNETQTHPKDTTQFLAKIDHNSQELLTKFDKLEKESQTIAEQLAILKKLPDFTIYSQNILLNDEHTPSNKNQSYASNACNQAGIKTHMYIGYMLKTEFSEFLKHSQNQAKPNVKSQAIYSQTNVVSETELLVVIRSINDIQDELFTFGFRKIDLPKSHNKISVHIKELELQLTKIAEYKQTTVDNLHKIAEIQTLQQLKSNLDEQILKLKGLMQANEYTSFAKFSAWVPEDKKDEFEKALPKQNIRVYEEDDSSAPTKLANNAFAKPFELITKLYSVPKSQGFDPTFFIALSFPIFFGIMLTDVAYGLALAIIASIMFVKSKDDGVRGFTLLLIISAIATMLFGAFFGSYFGNFFQMLGLQVPMVLDSMKDIIPMLVIVLSIGLIHISLGLIIGFSESIRAKNYVDAFKGQGLWLIFVVSILTLVASALFPGVGELLKVIGLSLLGVALLMQFGFNFAQDGPIKAVLSLFDFSGFMGDVFSYIRLMALAIGTSGIALAVNFMVFLAYDMIPYVGIIFAILIFIIGHAFNLVMNGLGGFIHTLRLHFLEHFSKYYEGGGREFTPYGKK
jgi:vacuolar-type H+-ATPase subunit I/STV1